MRYSYERNSKKLFLNNAPLLFLISKRSNTCCSRRFVFNELMRTGGMPSAHGAVVGILCLSIFYLEGFSTLFFAATVFFFIIIRDCFGVRWSVGEHAKIINQLIKHDQLQTKVKVVLGHFVFQSIMGIILGLAVVSLVHLIRLKMIIPA